MSPNPKAPGNKKCIRLRKSTILHPTDFGQINLAIVKNSRLPRYRLPAITLLKNCSFVCWNVDIIFKKNNKKDKHN